MNLACLLIKHEYVAAYCLFVNMQQIKITSAMYKHCNIFLFVLLDAPGRRPNYLPSPILSRDLSHDNVNIIRYLIVFNVVTQ